MIAVIGKNVPWPAAAVPRIRTGGGQGTGSRGETELGGDSQCPHNEEEETTTGAAERGHPQWQGGTGLAESAGILGKGEKRPGRPALL